MNDPKTRLHSDPRAIFNAGLDAVDPEAAVGCRLKRSNDNLWVDGQVYDLKAFKAVPVVRRKGRRSHGRGGGKQPWETASREGQWWSNTATVRP